MQHDHSKCCSYYFCAHPKCCGYYGPAAAAKIKEREIEEAATNRSNAAKRIENKS